MDMKFMTIVISGAVLLAPIAIYALEQDARVPVPDFVRILESGRVYENTEEEMQAALRSIGRLASRFQGLEKAAVRSLPGFQATENVSQDREAYTLVEGDDQSIVRIEYDTRRNQIVNVLMSHPDKSAVSVAYVHPAPRGTPQGMREGDVTYPGGRKHLSIEFKNNQPQYAIPSVGEPGRAGVVGQMHAWDTEGNLVKVHEVARPTEYFEAMRALTASLDPVQRDALGISPAGRLASSPVFQNADPWLKRDLDGAVAMAERYLPLAASNLPEAFGADVEIEPVEEEHGALAFNVKDGVRTAAVVEFEATTGRLQRVSSADGFNLVFEHDEKQRFVAASRQVETGWLMNFYPDWGVPRIAVYQAAPSIDADSDGTRMLRIWSPDGQSLIEEPLQPAESLTAILERAHAALTEAQKTEISWRGVAREMKHLLGTG